MSKTSSTPTYYGGSVSVNGENLVSSTLDGNNIVSNYNMSDTEKAIYDYAQQNLYSNLDSINTFSDETLKSMNSQIEAYTQNGIDLINSTYTPMLNDLKTDIASRFGNFDNTSFMSGLSSIEDSRADAISSLSQDVLSTQQSLYNDQLTNQYSYLSFLNDLQNQTTSNILNAVSASTSSSDLSYGTSSSYSSYSSLASALLGTSSIFG